MGSRVAQLVEQVAVNHRVAGSSPAPGAKGEKAKQNGNDEGKED